MHEAVLGFDMLENILFSSDTAHHHHFQTEEELIERFHPGQQITNKIRPLEENPAIEKKNQKKKARTNKGTCKGKGNYLTSVAKQAKTAFLHGPTVWKSPINP